MFQGKSSISLDAKGRMSIPVRHRNALSLKCEGRITLTRDPEGFLLLYPRPVWEDFREEMAGWSLDKRGWKRFYLGSACDVEMDSAGRVLISPELREEAGLERDVMLVGMATHFEIWDAGRLKKMDTDTIAKGLPDSLRNLPR